MTGHATVVAVTVVVVGIGIVLFFCCFFNVVDGVVFTIYVLVDAFYMDVAVIIVVYIVVIIVIVWALLFWCF